MRSTGIIAAGKTGTSSATMDTTFVGYTSRWITTVWMGDDMRRRPLGRKDARLHDRRAACGPATCTKQPRASPNLDIPWVVPEGVSPHDRGDKKGAGEPMPLVYKKHDKPEG